MAQATPASEPTPGDDAAAVSSTAPAATTTTVTTAAPAAAPAKSPWRVLLPVLVGVGALLIGMVIGGAGGFRLAHMFDRGGFSMMDERGGFGNEGFGNGGPQFGGPHFGGPGDGGQQNGPFVDRRDGGNSNNDDQRAPGLPPREQQNGDDAPSPDVTPAP